MLIYFLKVTPETTDAVFKYRKPLYEILDHDSSSNGTARSALRRPSKKRSEGSPSGHRNRCEFTRAKPLFLIRIRFFWTARLAFNDMSGLSMTRKAKPGPSERHGINSKNSTKSCSSPVAHNETLRKRAKPNLSSPSGLMSLYQIRPACAGSRSFRIHPQESPL